MASPFQCSTQQLLGRPLGRLLTLSQGLEHLTCRLAPHASPLPSSCGGPSFVVWRCFGWQKHKAALRRLSQGTLPAMLNSDGELEEDGETHQERLRRVEAARKAREEGEGKKKEPTQGQGEGQAEAA